jgi:hypothetical protein
VIKKAGSIALGVCVAAAMGVVALATPADAGETSTLLRAKVSKNIDGPFRENLHARLAPNSKKNFYFKVNNRTDDETEATLTEDGDDIGYATKFYRGDTNITTHVRGGGYDFFIAANGSSLYRIKATRGNDLGINRLQMKVQDVALRYATAKLLLNVG